MSDKRPVLILDYTNAEPCPPEKEEPTDWCECCGGDGDIYDHDTRTLRECPHCHGTGHKPQPCPHCGYKEKI